MNSPTLRRSHSGSIETSEILKRADLWVSRRFVFTSIEMQKALNLVSVRDVLRHLRSNGVPISPAKYERTTESGSRVFRYELLS